MLITNFITSSFRAKCFSGGDANLCVTHRDEDGGDWMEKRRSEHQIVGRSILLWKHLSIHWLLADTGFYIYEKNARSAW